MLHEEVVGRVRAMLLDGEIPPGARIPERDLCEKLQISRTPLREALKVLAAEGLVQLLPNRGSRAARLTDKDMRDLFEVCQGLEALAGELGRHELVIAETDANDPTLIRERPAGYALDAIWSDDFHHALHALR